MQPEEKELLEEAVTLSRQNNAILRKMQRSAAWSRFFNIVYYVIIIGVAIGAFYFLDPYLSSIIKTYTQLQNDVNSFKNFVK